MHYLQICYRENVVRIIARSTQFSLYQDEEPAHSLASVERRLARTASTEEIKCVKFLVYSQHSMNCFACVRMREQYHSTCGRPTSSPSTTEQGISLRSLVWKAFARIVLHRLHKLAERVYPETQCGFRAGITIDNTLNSGCHPTLSS